MTPILPPRTPHKTFIVNTIIYSAEIPTAGWAQNKRSTSLTTQDSHTYPFALVTLTHDANPKVKSLTLRQPPPMPVPGVECY